MRYVAQAIIQLMVLMYPYLDLIHTYHVYCLLVKMVIWVVEEHETH